MTDLLEQAFAEASKLSPQRQDAIADWLLRELDSDRRWDESLRTLSVPSRNWGPKRLKNIAKARHSRMTPSPHDL